MIPENVRAALGEACSILVGTVDAEGVPAACRAVGLRRNDDCSAVTVFLPAATAQQAIANLATTRRIAIAVSEPLTHTSIQFKGTTRAVRVAQRDEELAIDAYITAYTDKLEMLGVPRSVTSSVAHHPAFAVDVDVVELFDQTPGPRAGTLLP